MLTLHLARHAETAHAAEGRYAGDIDPPLTSHGAQQAERLAQRVAGLGLTALYASPKLRARLTAEPIERATGLTAVVEPGLREIGYGRWEGEKSEDVRAREPELFAAWSADPGLVAPPGGESGFDVLARAMPVILAIRACHADGRVLVVSHKATIRVLTCALLGIDIGRFRDRIACTPTSLTTFELHDHGAMLVRMGSDPV